MSGSKKKDNKSYNKVSQDSFNENDRRQLNDILNTVKNFADEIQELRKELDVVKMENHLLKQAVNLQLFKSDDLEQYGRRENIRVHAVPEQLDNHDDGEKIAFEMAQALHINLKDCDIQRAHRLGAKKKSLNAKPRPIIVRFTSYKKRNEVLFAKKELKDMNSGSLKSAYITEDLTPLRAKLLRYIKEECKDKFVMCHTYNGKIRAKKSAKEMGKLPDNYEKDEGVGNWITFTSPEDFFKHDIDIKFDKLGYKPLLFNKYDSETGSEGNR